MLSIVIGVAVIASVAILFLKKYLPEYSIIISIVSSGVLLLVVVLALSKIVGEIKDIFGNAGLDEEILTVVLKSLGLCYLTEFAADICRDFGQTSLSSKVELAGKVSIVILTLPFINQIITAAVELIG